jgi:hypothetical protein
VLQYSIAGCAVLQYSIAGSTVLQYSIAGCAVSIPLKVEVGGCATYKTGAKSLKFTTRYT